jgi:O-antigen/teichoic acid export membrane protein
MPNLRRLTQEGTWILGGQIAAVIGSIVLVRVLTERLPPAEYGRLALGLTIGGIVNQVFFGGILAGIGRHYTVAAEEGNIKAYIDASKRLMLRATFAVLALGIIAFFTFRSSIESQWGGLAVLALSYSLISCYIFAASSVQNAARQRALVAIHGAADPWLRISATVLIVILIGASAESVLIGYAVSVLIVLASQTVFLARFVGKLAHDRPVSRSWTEAIWKFSVPFYLWGPFTWSHLVSDRWLLEAFASTTEVGQFAVLYQLGYVPMSLATNFLVSFAGPILYQHAGKADDKDRISNVHRSSWQIAYLCMAVTLIGTAVTFAFHTWIYKLLVSDQYGESSYLLPWLILAGGGFATGQVLALKLMAEMRTSVMTKTKIITAAIGIVFNFTGGAIAGLQGVVIALAAFSIVYLSWMAILASRITHLSPTHSK